MSDEKLEGLITEYAELAKENKNIDTAALLESALMQEEQNRLSNKTKRWAYLISLGVPPVGFLLAFYFFFTDKSDGKQTAYVCAALTALSLIMTIVLFKTVFNSAGVSPQQIEQIKPKDIYQLSQ